MSLFFTLTKFELRKMLCRRRAAIVLLLVTLVATLSVFGTLIGTTEYTDEDGNTITLSGIEEEKIDRANAEALKGRVIDADLIMETVEAYSRIPLGSQHYSTTAEYQLYARKYSEIYRIVRGEFGISSIEEFTAITREQAEQFDAIRKAKRNAEVAGADISEDMRAYWQAAADKTDARLIYEYSGAYDRFVTILYTTGIMAGGAIAILLSGLFSEEYTCGADNLILSSRHDKGRLVAAKLTAAFAVSAGYILLLVLATYLECIAMWGTDGAGRALALGMNIFPYPITMGKAAVLYVISLVMGCVMFAAITVLCSARLKSPFNTMIVMAVLLIAPMFISVPDEAPVWLHNMENLLPSSMFAFWGAMASLQYEIGSLIIPPYVFLPMFALLMSIICTFFAARGFQKHQVS